jgi:phospho-2-dehydro-3-deoxyheptonate aldolase
MNILLPNPEQTQQINEARLAEGAHMERAGRLEGPLGTKLGPCATDANQHEDGEFAAVRHITAMAEGAEDLPDIEYAARKNGTKPRTRGGTTGLIHENPEAYGRMANSLTNKGIRLVAEVMDESDAAIAGPWLAAKWGGARNLQDTGVRQLLRPTEQELAAGIAPAPAYVKSDALGHWEPVYNAIHAIKDSKPVPRSLLTLNGLVRTVTHGNEHVGLILRGHKRRPDGPLDEIMAEEVTTARQHMDNEFGKGAVPIYVDVSHDHAKWEGGGEAGQLAIAESLGRLMTIHGIVIDGVMAETYLLPGKQADSGTIPGLSRVDACVGQTAAITMMQGLNDARAQQQLIAVQAHLSRV